MRSKIKLNEQSGRSVAEVFDDFVFAQTIASEGGAGRQYSIFRSLP